MTNTLSSFIFASSRSWHEPEFESLKNEMEGHWEWVSTPEELRIAVKQLDPKYVFFLHWNWRVEESIWSEIDCVCFHMSDVPYGRGGTPLQNLIVRGHDQTQLTALRMVEEVDAGPVYTKRPLSLEGRAEEVYIRAGKLSTDIIKWMIETNPVPLRQEGEVEVFNRRTPEESLLPEHGELVSLFDHIRMLDAPGYPHAFAPYGEFQLEFVQARKQGDEIYASVVIKKKSS